MKHLSRRPKWWVLYLLLGGFLAFLALVSLTPVPPAGHEIILIVVVLAVYVAMMIWIFTNGEALQDEEDLRQDANVHRRQMPITERQATYRLAMIRHDTHLQTMQTMQTRNGSHDETT